MARAALGLLIFASGAVLAQSPASRPEFEVASVKPAPPAVGGRVERRMGGDPGMITYTNVPLKALIARAYNVKQFQIEGPEWIGADGFNVTAKMPPNTPQDQVPLMLQSMLESRFKLKIHREEKAIPVYALTVGKSGLKLEKAEAEEGVRMQVGPKGREINAKTTLASLSTTLSNLLDRPVLDQTGTPGIFDFKLAWTPDDRDQNGTQMRAKMGVLAGGDGPAPAGEDLVSGPSLFAVLEKLGLKLEPRKSSAEILVIDSVERVPTEN